MKRFLLSFILVMTCAIASFGRGIMTFSEAQQQAYYLTDKMAYELDLTPVQYDQVYQVNLEYFLNVSGSDPWGYYWNYRNTDLAYILYDWQYGLYTRSEYFYRPIQWRRGAWYLPLWDFYARTHFYFDRPSIWHTWRGGLWTGRVHNTPSPFIGHRPPTHNGGMRHDPYPGGHPGHHDGGHHHGSQPGHNGNNGGSYNRPNGGSQPGHNGNNGGSYNRPNGGSQPGHNGNNGGSYYRPNGGSQPGHNGNNGNTVTRPNGGSHHNNSGGSYNRPNGGSGQSHTGGANRVGAHTGGTRSFGGGHR